MNQYLRATRRPQALLYPSPTWADAMPGGPVGGTKLTGAYVAMVARDAYFWAWPLVNVYSRRLAFKDLPEIVMAGPIPAAPLNRLGMLRDYISWDERVVACPNQDVVYGGAALALDLSPVVVQVPEFGSRFWVYQVVDLRTDSFAALGTMYASRPGFYLLVGPGWRGEVPKGINQVFRAKTNTGFIIARVFQEDTSEDKRAVQSVLQQICDYPLSEFDGTFKIHDWSKLKKVPPPSSGDEEQRWVIPEEFFDVLPRALADAPPLPGEEARYAQVLAVLDVAKDEPTLKEVLTKVAVQAETELISPLLKFSKWGLQLPHNWSTIVNGAAFGTDYFTRTAVARSNMFVNSPTETAYFYQDFDSDGTRLNGANRYSVTFANGATPPVNGFWSLTLYNEHHFFAPNDINRYSLGTKNKTLELDPDGSLTICVQAEPPRETQRSNWLPAPKNGDFSLYIRAYWPKVAILDGSWTPPAVRRAH